MRRLLLLAGVVAVLAALAATVSPAYRDGAAAGPTAKEWREAGADVFELALRRKILHERLAAILDGSMSEEAAAKALELSWRSTKGLEKSAEEAKAHARALWKEHGAGAGATDRDAMRSFEIAAIWAAAEARVWIDVLGRLVRQGDAAATVRSGWQKAVADSARTGPKLRDAWKKLQRQYLAACSKTKSGTCTPPAAPPAAPTVPKTPPPVPKPITFEQELLSSSWTFGRVNGAVICTITFTKTVGRYGDYVLKARFPNESFWRLEGNTLTFLHSDGTPTSKLTRKNANYWEGPYLGHPTLPNKDGTIHYIRR